MSRAFYLLLAGAEELVITVRKKCTDQVDLRKLEPPESNSLVLCKDLNHRHFRISAKPERKLIAAYSARNEQRCAVVLENAFYYVHPGKLVGAEQ